MDTEDRLRPRAVQQVWLPNLKVRLRALARATSTKHCALLLHLPLLHLRCCLMSPQMLKRQYHCPHRCGPGCLRRANLEPASGQQEPEQAAGEAPKLPALQPSRQLVKKGRSRATQALALCTKAQTQTVRLSRTAAARAVACQCVPYVSVLLSVPIPQCCMHLVIRSTGHHQSSAGVQVH